jgi:O-antigen/teichoic acid export membrane protein
MSSESRQTFFKQSGWMLSATLAGGAFMFAVHVFAPFMGDTEYGLFGALLAMMNLMTIPGLGLQTVFAQQTAASSTPEQRQLLALTIRALLKWTFIIWVGMVVVFVTFQKQLLSNLTITNPAGLWITLAVALGQLWMPIAFGVLQGQQNFVWLGWSNIINGAGRFIAVAIIVVLLGGKATGAVAGAWIGIFCAVALAMYHSRGAWWGQKSEVQFVWKEWLGRVVPLTFGLGAAQFIFSVDMIFVRSLFGEAQTGYYSAAGMLGRGLVIFTAPLSAVMFPKIVQSLAHGKRSNVLLYTLLATAALGAIAATICTAAALGIKHIISTTGEIPLAPAGFVAKLRANPDGMGTLSSLIPWFVWCMLPLAVGNVLLNNLLARKRYRIVLYLVGVAVAYGLMVRAFGTSFIRVIQILGVFNLIFLTVLSVFTFIDGRHSEKQQP